MLDRANTRSHLADFQETNASFGRHPPLVSDHSRPGLSNNVYSQCISSFTSANDPAALGALALASNFYSETFRRSGPAPLYTIEERRRRDESPWTFVQGVLAP